MPSSSSLVREVTVRPGVGMLALFPAMSYKAWYAIGEFVDNALQSWKANHKQLVEAFGDRARLEIEVEFNEASKTIIVSDNAAGISATDIPRAFRPASPPADTSGLSQFGIGMKSAATWYSSDFSITTTALHENVRRTVRFDVPAIVESDLPTIPLLEEPADPLEHGTKLVLSNLNQPIPKGRTLWKIRDYLQSIYRTFVADPEVRIVVQGKELGPVDPGLLTAPRWDRPHEPPVKWRKDIDITLPSGAHVTGWAGLLNKGRAKQAGFALLYRGKVVKGAGGAANDAEDGYKPYEIFGAPNSFESQRLIGELNVANVPVTHTKDALLWEGDDEDRLIRELAEVLDSEPLPLLRMARGHRVTERGRNAQRVVKNALDSVARSIEAPTPDRPTIESAAQPAAVRYDPSTLADPVEHTIALSALSSTLTNMSIRVLVIDQPDTADRWIRLTQNDDEQGNRDEWTLELNRSHRFMQSFANVPTMDIEPIIRLVIAFALVQTRAERSGALEPRLLIPLLNDTLDGALSKRIEL